MSFFRNWVLHNWGLKLLALVLSFLLWATYTAEPVAEEKYEAPIVFRNLPEGTDLSGEEPAVAHVVMRGRGTLLRRLQPADLALTVDLTGQAAGESLIHLTQGHINLPLGTEVVRITPAEARVRLVPRTAAP